MLKVSQAWLGSMAESEAPDRLARLFEAHHLRLYRLALRMVNDREEAKDLVQETFLRAAHRPASIPKGEPDGERWLVRVLVNLCRDRHRRETVRAAGRVHLSRQAPPPDPGEEMVARDTVRQALASIAPRRRAVLVLTELEDRSIAETARLLKLTQATVRWHLWAGRRQLARMLQPVQETR